MCLGIPGRITEVWAREDGAPMAHADFVGEVKKVCLAYHPQLTIGDYVIMHMGYAVSKIEEDEAIKTIGMMKEYGVVQ